MGAGPRARTRMEASELSWRGLVVSKRFPCASITVCVNFDALRLGTYSWQKPKHLLQ